jgi:DNA-binding GntR family transcriptional regulator
VSTDQGPTKLHTGPSLSDQSYRAMRQMIVNGTLEPGERLTERALGNLLGVSPTPIREAFRRLEHERLIERRDGRNVTVAAPSLDELRKVNLMQAALRGVAARLAAECGTDDELAAIAAAHERSIDPSQRTKASPAARIATTRGLHELIDRAAHSPLLSDMIATTTAFDLAERIRAAETLRGSYPTIGIDEHGQIVEALVARDGERAEVLMRAHLTRTGEFFLALRHGAGTLPAATQTERGGGNDDYSRA